MSKYLSEIKCVKCNKNAETEPNRSEYTKTYPIRSKDGTIYCWDCYKNISCCKVCQKSVANLKFSWSGNPHYPHASGYSRNCERVENEVKFICSQKCADKLSAERYQDWKEKLSQGWTKCEECWRFWSEEFKGGENFGEWLKEEKNQRGFIKLVQPGQGKLCSDHKGWEEGGKQEYERQTTEYQKRWEALSNEEKLSELKKEYRHGENITELATRSEIPPMVLYKWREKDSHHQHNCPDCQLDHEPTSNSNNLSTNEDNTVFSSKTLVNNNELSEKEIELQECEAKENKDWKRISELKKEINFLKNQQQNNSFPKDFWVIGISIFALLGGIIYLIKRKNSTTKVKSTKYKIK